MAASGVFFDISARPESPVFKPWPMSLHRAGHIVRHMKNAFILGVPVRSDIAHLFSRHAPFVLYKATHLPTHALKSRCLTAGLNCLRLDSWNN